VAYERAKLLGQEHYMGRLQAPVDWSIQGTSSWVNHVTDRDRVAYWEVEPLKELDLVRRR